MTPCPDCGRIPALADGLWLWRCECGRIWPVKTLGCWTPERARVQNERADQTELRLEVRRAERAIIDAALRACQTQGDSRAAHLANALEAAEVLIDLTG